MAWSIVRLRVSVGASVRKTGGAVVGGLMSMAAYGCVIWPSARGTMGAVSALREASVVFAALIGCVFLSEVLIPRRLASCAVVAMDARL